MKNIQKNRFLRNEIKLGQLKFKHLIQKIQSISQSLIKINTLYVHCIISYDHGKWAKESQKGVLEALNYRS